MRNDKPLRLRVWGKDWTAEALKHELEERKRIRRETQPRVIWQDDAGMPLPLGRVRIVGR